MWPAHFYTNMNSNHLTLISAAIILHQLVWPWIQRSRVQTWDWRLPEAYLKPEAFYRPYRKVFAACLMCPEMCLILYPLGRFRASPQMRFNHEKPCFYSLTPMQFLCFPPPPLKPTWKMFSGRFFIGLLKSQFSKTQKVPIFVSDSVPEMAGSCLH